MRRFKLRNNAVVEEWRRDDTNEANGYIDDYKVIDYGDINSTRKARIEGGNGWLCLPLSEEMPVGGAWGNGFDIVEEIKEGQ